MAKRWKTCFDLHANLISTKVSASQGKCTQGLAKRSASRPKFSTCEYLRFRLARALGVIKQKVELMTKPRTYEGLNSTKYPWIGIVSYQYWSFTPSFLLIFLRGFLFCFRCLCNGHADSCNVNGKCSCLNNTMEDCPSTSDCYKNQVQLNIFLCADSSFECQYKFLQNLLLLLKLIE